MLPRWRNGVSEVHTKVEKEAKFMGRERETKKHGDREKEKWMDGERLIKTREGRETKKRRGRE